MIIKIVETSINYDAAMCLLREVTKRIRKGKQDYLETDVEQFKALSEECRGINEKKDTPGGNGPRRRKIWCRKEPAGRFRQRS